MFKGLQTYRSFKIFILTCPPTCEYNFLKLCFSCSVWNSFSSRKKLLFIAGRETQWNLLSVSAFSHYWKQSGQAQLTWLTTPEPWQQWHTLYTHTTPLSPHPLPLLITTTPLSYQTYSHSLSRDQHQATGIPFMSFPAKPFMIKLGHITDKHQTSFHENFRHFRSKIFVILRRNKSSHFNGSTTTACNSWLLFIFCG